MELIFFISNYKLYLVIMCIQYIARMSFSKFTVCTHEFTFTYVIVFVQDGGKGDAVNFHT